MTSLRLPIALQQAVMRTLRNKLQLANQRLERNYPEPAVSWQQRGTAAGSAWPLRWEIRLNPVLLMENQQTFIDQVVPHELAHLLVWKQFGRVAPHGKEWKWMMSEILEVPALRTHRFDVDSVKSRLYPWYCDCQQHQLTLRRHNKAVRGSSQYRCIRCNSLLAPGVWVHK